jgi:hypothetical protein
MKNEQNLGIKHALGVETLLRLVKHCENAVLLRPPLTKVRILMFTLLTKQSILANKKIKKEVDNEESL